MRESIYVDTSVVSAYFDERIPYQKERTRLWWENERIKDEYMFCLSGVTIEELNAVKDPARREKYLKFIEGIEILEYRDEIKEISEIYLSRGVLRAKAIADALHVAYCSIYKIDYLVTWNISDLAKPGRKKKIQIINALLNLVTPDIITPEFFEV